jgi:hypothetical protein
MSWPEDELLSPEEAAPGEAIPSLADLAAQTLLAAAVVQASSGDPFPVEAFEHVRALMPAQASRIASQALEIGAAHPCMFGPELQSLRVACELTPQVSDMLGACEACEALQLDACPSIDPHALDSLLRAMPMLSTLALRRVEDTGYTAALAACSTLHVLDLGNSTVSLDSLLSLSMPSLRAFRLQFSSISSEQLEAIVSRCPKLGHLNLEGSAALESVDTVPSTLETLNLKGCSSVKASSLGSAVERMFEVGKVLRGLNLAECNVTNTMLHQWGSKVAVCSAASEGWGASASAPALESLDLSWVDDLTGAAVTDFVVRFPRLRRLELRCVGDGEETLKESEVVRMVESCPCLEEVAITRCDVVGDATAEHLSRLTGLRRLDLAWSLGLTDVGLERLMSGATSLSHVCLEGCKGLTEAGIAAVRGCDATRWISFAWVNAASKDVVDPLRVRLGRAKILDYYGLSGDDNDDWP